MQSTVMPNPNQGVRFETRLPVAHEKFRYPTGAEVRRVFRRLGWNAAEAKLKLGIDDITTRSWIRDEARVPCQIWQAMVAAAGLKIDSLPLDD
jgi:hypothetical protein